MHWSGQVQVTGW